jgi:hypothetical protein
MALLFASCASVKVPNFEGCADLTEDGAYCVKFLTGEERDVTPEDWDAQRFGRISLSPQDFTEIKKTLEKLCSLPNRCTYEEEQLVKNFHRRLSRARK